jgi:hypothetical protein
MNFTEPRTHFRQDRYLPLPLPFSSKKSVRIRFIPFPPHVRTVYRAHIASTTKKHVASTLYPGNNYIMENGNTRNGFDRRGTTPPSHPKVFPSPHKASHRFGWSRTTGRPQVASSARCEPLTHRRVGVAHPYRMAPNGMCDVLCVQRDANRPYGSVGSSRLQRAQPLENQRWHRPGTATAPTTQRTALIPPAEGRALDSLGVRALQHTRRHCVHPFIATDVGASPSSPGWKRPYCSRSIEPRDTVSGTTRRTRAERVPLSLRTADCKRRHPSRTGLQRCTTTERRRDRGQARTSYPTCRQITVLVYREWIASPIAAAVTTTGP